MAQEDIDRVQEFRKCISVLPVPGRAATMLRDHDKHEEFIGPRFFVYTAALEMHPLDNRRPAADLQGQEQHRYLQHHSSAATRGVPGAHPHHRQYAIIPLKERVIGRNRFYDPVSRLVADVNW
jgi:succinate dehydrogenase / fumarate reductase iron-sulfur subunit